MIKNTTVLLLIAFMLNPLCCCYAGLGCGNLDQPVQNSCCDKSPENTDPGAENCPHKNLSEINEQEVYSSNSLKALDVLSLEYSVLQIADYLTHAEVDAFVAKNFVGDYSPRLSKRQLNCTYLL